MDIEYCIYCKYHKHIDLKGYPPKPSERLCPICGHHMWYIGSDKGFICEITEYDECGVHGEKEYLTKLLTRSLEMLQKLD